MIETATEELQQELARLLGRRIADIERRPSAYRTSFAIEDLDLRFEGGARLRLVFKDVGPAALSEQARAAKPGFLYDPLREIETYRSILARRRLGTARCYGAVVAPQRDRFWLFLEKVPGIELYQVGELAVWQEVARWLARLHVRCRRARHARLLHYERELYSTWMRRALAFCPHPGLERLASVYDEAIGRLLELPATFVHGELYASNVLVAERASGFRVCPVDWEMAAVGPGLLDLAALTTGAWSDEEREAIALSYYDALPRAERLESFLEQLDRCRLHTAVQWLGWSDEWAPPAEHAHDWLGEALRAAERLRLL